MNLAKDFLTLTLVILLPYPEGIFPTCVHLFLSIDVKIVAPEPFSQYQIVELPFHPPISISSNSHSLFISTMTQPGEEVHTPFNCDLSFKSVTRLVPAVCPLYT